MSQNRNHRSNRSGNRSDRLNYIARPIDEIFIEGIYYTFIVSSLYKSMTSHKSNFIKKAVNKIIECATYLIGSKLTTIVSTLLIVSPIILLGLFVYYMFKFTNKDVMLLNYSNSNVNMDHRVESRMNTLACGARRKMRLALNYDTKLNREDKNKIYDEYGDYIDNTIGYHMYKYDESKYGLPFGYYDFRDYIKDLYGYSRNLNLQDSMYDRRMDKMIYTNYVFNCDGYDYDNGKFEAYRMILDTDENDLQIYIVYKDCSDEDAVLLVEYNGSKHTDKIMAGYEMFVNRYYLGFGRAFDENCNRIGYYNPTNEKVTNVGTVEIDGDNFHTICEIFQ